MTSKFAQALASGNHRNICVLLGAGGSVAAGLPDFRSAGGMYDMLRPDLLTATESQREKLRHDPTLVVSWELFRKNPLPYLEVRREFIIGVADQRWKSTAGHFFIRLLQDRGMLRRLYTTNIDGLDHIVGLDPEKVVNVHGTLSRVECEFCGAEMPLEEFKTKVIANVKDITLRDGRAPVQSKPVLCTNPTCGAPGVKPTTTLYGLSLPSEYFEKSDEDFPDNTDMLIVMGSSLSVRPSCGLVEHCADHVPRVLINRDAVGRDLGMDYDSPDDRDMFLPGDVDDNVIAVCVELGWLHDLAAYAPQMADSSRAKVLAAVAQVTGGAGAGAAAGAGGAASV